MDVNEATKKKLEVQGKINKLLLTFQEETDCRIEDISLIRYYDSRSEKPINFAPQLKVVL